MATHRANATQSAGTGTNTTLTKPTGTADGDILIAFLNVENDVVVTPPVGWSWLRNIDHSSAAVDQWVFWKRAGSAEGSSYTFSHSSTWRSGYIVAVQNASADVNPAVSAAAQGTGTTATANAVTVAAAQAFVAFLVNTFGDMGLVTPPTGFTERWDSTNNVYAADISNPSTGSTGSIAAGSTFGGGSQNWAATLVLVEDDDHVVNHPNVTHATSEVGTSLGSTNAQPLPDNAASGDLVIYFCANDNTGATNMSGSTGWTTGTLQGTTGMESQFFARVLDGTTGDNILSITGAAQDYAVIGLRIPSGQHPVTSGNIATWVSSYVTATTGASGNADPANLSPGSSSDTLWIAAAAVDCTNANDQITDDPSGYLNLGYVKSAASTTSVALRVAYKQATASSDNPGTFTNTSLAWHGWTVGVPSSLGAGGQTLTMPTIASGETLYGLTLTPGAIGITLPTIAAGSTLTAPTLTPGAVTLSLPNIAAASALNAPTVTPGAVTLSLPTIASSETLTAPTLVPGAIGIDLPTIASGETLYAPTLSAGGATIELPTISSGSTLNAPTLTPGAVTIDLPAIASGETLNAPALTPAGALGLPTIASGEQTYPPTLTPGAVGITLPTITSGSTVAAPTLTPGAVTIDLPTITAGSTLYAPSLTASGALGLPTITSGSTLYAVTLTPGAVTVDLPTITSGATLYAFRLGDEPIVWTGRLTTTAADTPRTTTAADLARDTTAADLTRTTEAVR